MSSIAVTGAGRAHSSANEDSLLLQRAHSKDSVTRSFGFDNSFDE